MPKTKPNFEKNISELENIIHTLESGNSGLDESITLYEKGVKLSGECLKILENAKQKIEVIKNSNYEVTNLEDTMENTNHEL